MSCFLPNATLLKSYLLVATRNAHDADDLLQEVSSVLWEKFESYDSRSPFQAWALGIARLEVLKWRQRQVRSRELLSEAALDILSNTAVQYADVAEARKEYLSDCLDKLPQPMGEAIRLRYANNLSIAKIAARMHKNVGAVEMLLVRARRALRECVERCIAQGRMT